MEHDQIYTARYYRRQRRMSVASMPAIARFIVSRFAPQRVIDVGCGLGLLISELKGHGVDGLGIELSAVALESCRENHVSVLQVDLARGPYPSGLRSDVAVTLEVAEHLPAESADEFVKFVCGLSSNLVFSAAVPGQGGRSHLNEQPHSYWSERIEKHGFVLNRELTRAARREWRRAGTARYYHRNVMVFTV